MGNANTTVADAPAGDVIDITTSAAALPARLDAVLRDRAELVRTRSMASLRSVAWSALGFVACLAIAYGLYIAGSRYGILDPELMQVVAIIVALVSLAPLGLVVTGIPGVLGFDPFGAYLKRVTTLVRALQPDLHPRAPVHIHLDLRTLENVAPIRTAVSPHSGKTKEWRRVRRLELVLLLADGTVFAFRASEKSRHKAGIRERGEGQLVGRLDHRGARGLAPTASQAPFSGWESALTDHAFLFWRKSGSFRQDLPDVQALYARLRPAGDAVRPR